MILAASPASQVTTLPHKFTDAEKKRLLDAKAEVDRLDELLNRACNVRSAMDSAAEDFAAGTITLETAIGLIGSAPTTQARHDIEKALCRPVKRSIKAAIAKVDDLIQAARASHIQQLCDKCANLDREEKQQLTDLGLSPDDHNPSALLLSLREQHSRAKGFEASLNSRADFNGIVASIA